MSRIEVRLNDDKSLDEIVGKASYIHVEQMDSKCWWLCVGWGGGREEVRVYFTSRTKIKATREISGPVKVVGGK